MGFTESSHSNDETTIKNLSNTLPERTFDHVMCFGTFDIFHPGHVFYLSEAQRFAKKMTIVIARDARVATLKGRPPQDNENTRQSNVANAFPGAIVILGDVTDIFAPLRKYAPDILAFGYDQRVPEGKIHELFPALSIQRIGGYETERWKSSLLRDK